MRPGGNDKGAVIRQSGVIAVRESRQAIEYLLITSRRRKRWLFPKGSVPEGMDARSAAAMEAYEEAGVTGVVMRSLGSYWTRKGGAWCAVTLYLMRVTEIHPRWPEQRVRTRRWMRREAALDALTRHDLRSIFHRASRLFGSRRPG